VFGVDSPVLNLDFVAAAFAPRGDFWPHEASCRSCGLRSGFCLPQDHRPSRAGQFLRLPLPIPGILAVRFPHRHAPSMTGALSWRTRQRVGGSAMTFEEIVDQALAMLQRRGRVGYRLLKRQFQLDDAAL
jgi:hypothetical protein